jgi:hypothetical protein
MALLIVATAGVADVQTTVSVRFCFELSEYTPVAVNCCRVPSAMLGMAGVTPIDTSAAPVTVSVVEAEMLPDATVMVVDPMATAVATPLAPTIEATAGALELQVSEEMYCLEPSL